MYKGSSGSQLVSHFSEYGQSKSKSSKCIPHNLNTVSPGIRQ